MAYIGMAYIGMAYIGMAYIGMAYIVMAKTAADGGAPSLLGLHIGVARSHVCCMGVVI